MTWLLIPIDSYRSNTTSVTSCQTGVLCRTSRDIIFPLSPATVAHACCGRASLHPPPLAHGQVRLSLSHLMMADSCQGRTVLITTSEKTPQCWDCLTTFPVFAGCLGAFMYWYRDKVLWYFTSQYGTDIITAKTFFHQCNFNITDKLLEFVKKKKKACITFKF